MSPGKSTDAKAAVFRSHCKHCQNGAGGSGHLPVRKDRGLGTPPSPSPETTRPRTSSSARPSRRRTLLEELALFFAPRPNAYAFHKT
jgi:hypothetical protein